ncbi:hypothetical protein JCM30471_22530 [Desulfuromonas carbonis]|uniref:permease n=1 Tax=Desulfuromonas sp. DDH964 TaxID=1823759 RepID=UPI00078E8288|nr:permease [Desulfuromonas sp. DDH964]AMV73833.1 hypothetical protein DBW_3535 [Desulfuromonas sp. DDH964]
MKPEAPKRRIPWLPMTVGILYLWALTVDPARTWQALRVSAALFASVAMIIVAVFGLAGLIQVWLDRERVARLLGREGGIRALLLAALFGTLLIGPSYVIFPLLKTVREQGARWAVLGIVLAAWAVKIPMLPLEMEFLGWRFSLARSLLTLLFAFPIGLLLEFAMEYRRR